MNILKILIAVGMVSNSYAFTGEGAPPSPQQINGGQPPQPVLVHTPDSQRHPTIHRATMVAESRPYDAVQSYKDGFVPTTVYAWPLAAGLWAQNAFLKDKVVYKPDGMVIAGIFAPVIAGVTRSIIDWIQDTLPFLQTPESWSPKLKKTLSYIKTAFSTAVAAIPTYLIYSWKDGKGFEWGKSLGLGLVAGTASAALQMHSDYNKQPPIIIHLEKNK